MFSDIEGWSGKLLGSFSFGLDPQFADVGGPDGVIGTADDDSRLSKISPCIDGGNPSYASVDTDLGGWPRLLDGDLDGIQRLDIGASEFSQVELKATVEQDAVHGNTYLVLDVLGPRSMKGQLLVGCESGLVGLPPYGALLFDPAAGWMRYPLGPLPLSLTVNVTPLVGLVGPVTLQALGVERGVGNLSNAVKLDLHP